MVKDPLLQSLVYVSRYFGQSNSPDALVSGLPISDGYLSPFLFPRAAERAGIDAKESRQALKDLSPMLCPCVLLLKDNQACVLQSINHETGEAEVVEPLTDTTPAVRPISELEEDYLGRVFLLKKQFRYDERSPEILKERQGHWFWSTLWESRSIYRDVLIASIFINAFAIATPLFSRIVYDKIVPNLAFDSLWVLATGVFVIFLFDLVLKMLRSYFIDISGKKSDLLISSRIFEKVMGIRMEARPPSVGAFARHMQEFESIRDFFTSASVSALIDLPFAFFFLFIIWIVAGPLVIVPIAAVLILMIHAAIIQKPLRHTIEEGSRLSSQKNANLIESLAGLETIKLFGAESQFQYRWEEAVAHMANWGIKTRRLTDSVQNAAGFIQQFVNVSMIVFGVYLISAGDLTMGGLIAATMLSSRAVGPMVQLSLLSTRYNQAKSAMEIISQLMDMPSEQEEGKRYIHRPIIRGKIEFDRVNFNYPNSEVAALRDISFTILPGEKVAIIGRIGSGKTTLSRLLMGLYRPTAGSVRIDETDISQIHNIDIRRNIGCVPQDPILFFGSIRDNITLGRPLADDRDILDAANRSGVTTFTQRDPAGLERQVGEGGNQLSGGQRQSIAIARAMLGRPPVLLMDEPTSAMDNRSEQYIKQQMSSLRRDETLIINTHKTGMLDVVDRIIVVEQGSIVADGPKLAVLQALKDGKIQKVG
ncbi:ABC transporter [Grimontia sp. AD028]|uniref:ABC transporter, transmembrane region:ABC transporter:Peptidase C39, bacteriocin processing n=1 Tax=Grimontia indica TaxID=1056512 RepID=R1GLU0_9GAMM|nr:MULTISPECIES: type I secretion system permease/ATPase [Grimontia]EOD77133.1 ABC transporter, transmembrane region:ABC transporter:Peptidase C39, bacteriocin processing [Grimontia indica]KKD58320.1 ABC transporter [Grimontia sp. AD028]